MSPTDDLSLMRALRYGVKLSCPNCGVGKLFVRKAELYKECSNCGLEFERKPGDTWAFLLFIDRACLLPPLAIVLFTPISLFGRCLLALLFVPLFIFTLPHRRGITVALDFYTRVRWPDPNDSIPS